MAKSIFVCRVFWKDITPCSSKSKVTNERNPVTNSYKEEKKKRFVKENVCKKKPFCKKTRFVRETTVGNT